jgi:hypothetical protein
MELSEVRQTEIREAIRALPAEDRRNLLRWLQELETEVPPVREPKKRPAVRPKMPPTLQQAVAWSLLSLLAFFLVDAAIFRSGWYYNYLEPDSTTAQLELQLFWLRHTLPGKMPEAAVVGDSRIAEGFGARKAGAATGDKIQFWNLGVSGSNPRAWYYLLRDGDPTRRRFRAITLGIDHYSDQDAGYDVANSVADLHYLIGRLGVTDCMDFAQSFPLPELHRPMLTGCLFKAVTLRRDVQGLLADPKKRFAAAKDWRNQGHNYIDGYEGKPEDLSGLTVDFEKRTLHFPEGVKEWQSSTALAMILPGEFPQTGELTAYRKRWLGRILDLYRDSPTRIIFLELPRGPVPTPERKAPERFVDSVRNRPRLTILPKETFRDLERPEVFSDGLHLNHLGRPIFSERLGKKMAEIVGIR